MRDIGGKILSGFWKKKLTKGKLFYNELSDYPNYPSSYGAAGWTKNDKTILVYDRYDIWEINPENGDSERLTNGRELKISYRLIKLDSDIKFIDTSKKLFWSLKECFRTLKL